MRIIFSALFFQLATARHWYSDTGVVTRAESPVIADYDFLDFWRTADAFAYQCRHSMKRYGFRGANWFVNNYDIVREAARFYEELYDGTEDIGDCICILPPFTLQFDEKASIKTNIDSLKHKLDCWIQESLNNIELKSLNI